MIKCQVSASELFNLIEDLGEKIENAPKGEKIITAKIVGNKLSFDVYMKVK